MLEHVGCDQTVELSQPFNEHRVSEQEIRVAYVHRVETGPRISGVLGVVLHADKFRAEALLERGAERPG